MNLSTEETEGKQISKTGKELAFINGPKVELVGSDCNSFRVLLKRREAWSCAETTEQSWEESTCRSRRASLLTLRYFFSPPQGSNFCKSRIQPNTRLVYGDWGREKDTDGRAIFLERVVSSGGSKIWGFQLKLLVLKPTQDLLYLGLEAMRRFYKSFAITFS